MGNTPYQQSNDSSGDKRRHLLIIGKDALYNGSRFVIFVPNFLCAVVEFVIVVDGSIRGRNLSVIYL